MAGAIAWPFSDASKVLRFYREFCASAPDELGSWAAVAHAPDGSGVKMTVVVVAYSGSLVEGEKTLASLKHFASPLFDTIQPMAYNDLNSMFDPAYPKGLFYYWKSNFLSTFSDETVDTMIAMLERCPSKFSGIGLEHWHGVGARVHQDQTAFSHRHEGQNLLILSQWHDPAANSENIEWARATFKSLQPFFAKARYVNYLDQDDAGDVSGPFGANYARLCHIKAKYDPKNLFHLNQNIGPVVN